MKQADPASVSLSVCDINAPTKTDCTINTSGTYIYDQSYGGRGLTITGTLNAVNNSLSFPMLTGWYSGVTINFSNVNLIPANANQLRSGISLFGLAGTFVSAANPACNLAAPSGLQSSACSASTGNFLFTTAYNGRSANCANYANGLANANCWVTTPGYTIAAASANPPNCFAGGGQGAVCTAASGSYYYDVDSGGRTSNCVSGLNSAPCWVATTGKNLTSSSFACTDNSLNSASCNTSPGRYVYPNAYGGRTTLCVNDLAGSCFVSQTSKATLEPNMRADRIKNGTSIFGMRGTFTGQGDWFSTMHRDLDTSPITMLTESITFAGSNATPLPAGYRMVPLIIKDDEGYSSTEVVPVSRIGWGSISCGLTQNTILLRISNCQTVFGANAVWDGTTQGNAGQNRWKLVSRAGDITLGKGREVWLDDKTGLLWSSLVSKNINWCKAVGTSNNVAVNARYREVDPQNLCNVDANQNNTVGNVVSACFEEVGFTNVDPDVDNAAKAGLALAATASSPAVAWRGATFNDYEVADAHGIRFVLPDMGKNAIGEEWMATVVSTDKNKAWTYVADVGLQLSKSRTLKAMVRCVGR